MKVAENKPVLWSDREAAIVTGGRVTGEWTVTGLALALEDIRPGDLYFAGPRDDIALALRRGAAAVCVQRYAYEEKYEHSTTPLLLVADVYQAMQDMARIGRQKISGPVIGIRAGHKTKAFREVVMAVFQTRGAVNCEGRNAPLSLASSHEDHVAGVCSITPLTRADIAIVADENDMGYPGLFHGMAPNAAVILNRDSAHFGVLSAEAQTSGLTGLISFGRHPEADIRINDIVRSLNGYTAFLSVFGCEYQLTLQDKSFIDALCATLASCLFAGWSVQDVLFANTIQQGSFESFFKVRHVVDQGRAAPQKLMLGNVRADSAHKQAVFDGLVPGRCLPRKMQKMDLMYKNRQCQGFRNALQVMRNSFKGKELVEISSDVLCPGDFVLMKNNNRARLSPQPVTYRLMNG